MDRSVGIGQSVRRAGSRLERRPKALWLVGLVVAGSTYAAAQTILGGDPITTALGSGLVFGVVFATASLFFRTVRRD